MRKLRLSHCKKSKNGAMGNFLILGNREYLITISDKHTKKLLDYFLTVVHELLHFAFTLARIKYKLQLSEKKEHKLIEEMEAKITDVFVGAAVKQKEKKRERS